MSSNWTTIPVGDALEKIARQKKVMTSAYEDAGLIPIIDQGREYIAGFTSDAEQQYVGKLPLTIFGDHTRILKWVDRPFAVGADGTQLLRGDDRFDQRFFYYALKSVDLKHFGYERHFKYLKEKEIPLPDLPTQRKIAGILSAYDDLIENNLRRIKILEEMAQNLYREWFVKFRFPGHGQARMIDSPCGKIPEKWALTPLGKIASLRKDKFDERLNAELPLLDLAKMRSRTLMVAETGTPAELTTSRILFQEDDILFGSIRPYLHKVALAPFQGVTNVSVLVLRPTAEFLRSFLAVLLSSEDTIRWADKHSTGTKMPVIKWEALASMLVPMPPPNLLNVFEASVQPMLQTVKTASSRNRNLRRTRDLLLPKLISGELDISELDIAVPEEQAA
jgi:type I restriction enzyme S subunit